MRDRRVRTIVVAAALAVQAACGCTDVPCINGLALHVSGADGAAPVGFSGEVAGAGPIVRFSCPAGGAGARCEGGVVYLRDISRGEPDTVRVTITSSAGESFRGLVEPDYESSGEKGPLCGVSCSSGEVAVMLGR